MSKSKNTAPQQSKQPQPQPQSATKETPQYHLLKEAALQLAPIPREATLARLKWLFSRAPHQVPPTTPDWFIWLLSAGRGGGKTYSSMQWLWWEAYTNPGSRSLIIAPTFADLQLTCLEGDSGLFNCMPASLLKKYKVSTMEVELINGSLIRGIPATEPERLRGPQFHRAVFEELAAWGPTLETADMAWDMANFCLRLGKAPRIVISTTPKPVPRMRTLFKQATTPDTTHVYITRASTYDNIENLAPTFQQQILQYEGTLLGRQEIHAELLDPEEQGIIKRSWFKMFPHTTPLPAFHYIIQSYDCATSDKTVNDPSAGITLGVFYPDEDHGPQVMVLDAWTDFMKYPTLREHIQKEFKSQWGSPNQFNITKCPDLILIEDKSAGISLIQELQQAGLPCRGYNPGRQDKAQRLNLVAPLVMNGLVWLPESNLYPGTALSFAHPLIDQLCAFPDVAHDDLTDCFSQALRFLRDANFISMPALHVQPTSPVYADDYVERRTRNPYAQ